MEEHSVKPSVTKSRKPLETKSRRALGTVKLVKRVTVAEVTVTTADKQFGYHPLFTLMEIAAQRLNESEDSDRFDQTLEAEYEGVKLTINLSTDDKGLLND